MGLGCSAMDAGEFIELVEAARSAMEEEERERLRVGKLIRLPESGSLAVFGDVHGDLKALEALRKEAEPWDMLLFLGDYGDRGPKQPEVYARILKLKADNPDRVLLLRGNHEQLPWLQVYPHDLPWQLADRFGSEGDRAYERLAQLWEAMPIAAVAEGKYLMLHGAPPVDLKRLEQLEEPSREHMEQVLWNDPWEGDEDIPSSRGAGVLVSKPTMRRVLGSIGVRTLIRTHEPCEGVKLAHRVEGRHLVLTVVSNTVYWFKTAAVVKLKLEDEAKTADELAEKHVKRYTVG
ncbi:MAG: hypothetical protein DRN99_06335 [Thermoproteota archaeon]|nr:MAG: hypothetical protein DRN99_06335 [Candidatus Korarchaeota archaeon]